MTSRPSLEGDEVHVWKAALDGSAAELGALSGHLSPEESARAAKFHFDEDKARFARGRGILRRILGRYLGSDPSALRLVPDANGKPGLAPEGSLSFNLSHSGGLALIAVCLKGPVGVDLERLRPVPDASNLVESYFSAEEKALFRTVAPERRDEEFLRLWTRKEAYLKACGEGLGRALDETPDPREGWVVLELQPAPGFAAAVAKRGAISRLSLLDWTLA